MAEKLAAARCSIHPDRPAAARCPECLRFFSAECITEHEGRLVCTSCLAGKASAAPRPAASRLLGAPAALLQLALAAAVCWLLFYFFARSLAEMPDAFHDGAVWKGDGASRKEPAP